MAQHLTLFFYSIQNTKTEEIILENCAIEPEIENIILFLKKAGYKIKLFKEQRKIIINKLKKLKSVENFLVLPDRIETITYCILSAILKKEIILKNIDYNSIKNCIKLLQSININIEINKDNLFVNKTTNIKNKKITFKPYPGIPTDIQPLICVLLNFANKKSILVDEVYPDRFEYIEELNRANLQIIVENGKIKINPINQEFKITNFAATDIRGGMACLLLASFLVLKYNCEIFIDNVYQIKRGYNNLIENFKRFDIIIEEY